MSRVKLLLSMFLVFGIASGAFAGANTPWGDVTKIKMGVVVQSGDTSSAWAGESASDRRGDITGNTTSFFTPTTEMTAAGDGTYQLKLDLVPNGVYNFIFRARLAENLAGYTTGQEFTEPIPSGSQTDEGGNTATSDPGFFISSSSVIRADPGSGSVSFISIGGDGRRRLAMPNVDPLSNPNTYYVFNNYASIPRGVANYSATPGQQSVELRWQGGLGTWGAGSPAIDCFGGGYALYMSSGAAGPYTLQRTFTGQTTYYRLTGLTNGNSYYFIFVSSDAYNGVTRSSYTADKAIWANLVRTVGVPTASMYSTDGYDNNDKSATPNTTVPVYFKVENIDEEYVKEHGNVVYMTPWNEDGRTYLNKIPGSFMVVYLPKLGS